MLPKGDSSTSPALRGSASATTGVSARGIVAIAPDRIVTTAFVDADDGIELHRSEATRSRVIDGMGKHLSRDSSPIDC